MRLASYNTVRALRSRRRTATVPDAFRAIARSVALLLLLLTAPAYAAITVNPASLPAGTVGTAYVGNMSATGGTTPYTYNVSAGALPAGLTLNASNGQIRGTPTTAGISSFTIQATDRFGVTGTRAYSVTINAAIVVSPASLPNWTLGVAYSQTVAATGGTGSYTFSRSSGTLPPGVSLNATTGALTGTPTATGTRTFTIRATDGNGAFGSRAYTVVIAAAIVVNPATLPGGTVGTAYSRTVTTTGGTGAKTFSVSAGTLPAGLALNASSGVISGTPTSAGSYAFTIRAADSIGAVGTRAYSVTINAAIVVSPASLPNWTLGVAYSQTVAATGGTGSYTFSRSAGTLPSGLSLNATTGAITGTPTATGTRTFTIRATDGNGAFGSRAYTVVIAAAIVVNPATLAGGTVGTAYSRTVTTTGGTGARTFSVSAGALPAGLALNASSGVISGTPTSAGSYAFTIRAADSIGAVGTRNYAVTIANPPVVVNPATLPGGAVGAAYSQVVSATGGTGVGYTFSVSAGSLGSGLTLNASTGAISGTPGTTGTRNFTIRARDSGGATGTRAYSIAISAAIVVNPASLPGGTAGTAYSQTITASGGNGSYTFGVSVGALPAGLTLNASSGLLSGTPTTAGVSSFTVRATDGNGASNTRAYSVTIAAAPIVVNPSTLPNGTVGSAYSQAVTASGGTGGFTYSVSVGTLPAGLSLNASSGVISGTPTAAATSGFTIRATDAMGSVGSRAYTLTMVAAPIVVNPMTLPVATVGSAYSQAVSAAGGTGSFGYSVSAGALPAGLALNASSGLISGTPTTAGATSFTITATDGNGAIGTRNYSVPVNAGIAVNPASLPAGAVGAPYSQTVTATGGSGSHTFSIGAGSLPTGLTLNASTGLISGTPASAGASSFTVTATDGNGAMGSRNFSFVVNGAMAVNPDTLPNAIVGVVYAQTLLATGGNGTYTFGVSSGSLPAGLTLNASTGTITGTPTTAASSSFTVMATDGLGVSASRGYTVDVAMATLTLESTLGNGTVGSAYNQAIVVSGGTAPYLFSISSGQLPGGVSLNGSTGALSGTPTVPGTYSFTIRVVDAHGATAAFAQAIVVEPRPDPSTDPVVRGMAAAQVSSAGRFGSAQIENVGNRVRMLHFGQDPCSLQFDVGTNIRWERASGSDVASAAAPQASEPNDATEKNARCNGPLAFWVGGSIDFGFLRPSSATERSDFTTSGLTLGADARVLPGLLLGASLGYGRDSSDVGSNRSESRAQGVNATLYGSYEPIKSVYVDFLVGYGRLNFDATRWQSDAVMIGDRSGSQTFGSVGVSAVLDYGRLTLTPYGRLDRVHNRLESYTESGPNTLALSYGHVTAIEDLLAAGLYASYRIPLRGAILEPSLRLEARRAHAPSFEQTLWYADLPMNTYVITDGSVSDNQLLGGIGLVLRFGSELSLGLDYSYTGSSGTYRSESVQMILRAPF